MVDPAIDETARADEPPAAIDDTPAYQAASRPVALPVAAIPRIDAVLAAIPQGRFRESLMKLAPAARERALTQLADHPVPEADYQCLLVDREGALLYDCVFDDASKDHDPTHSGEAANGDSDDSEGAAQGADLPAVPVSSPPVRHSKPGSPNTIYLDFNGQVITGTSWNDNENVASWEAVPYSLDADFTTFSSAEQANIVEIWERVSAHYAPFDVDVTTEEPAEFTPRTCRALITRNTDLNGVSLPGTGGGIAYVNAFGAADFALKRSPAFIYHNRVGTGNPGNIAELTAHESGHNMGLSHDGKILDTTPPTTDDYYDGHGGGIENPISWGAIMGNSYGRNVSHWSKGEYYKANNFEDDLAIIARKLDLKADEGGDLTTAAVAAVDSGALLAKGILGFEGDTDVFAFRTGAGPISLTTTPYRAATGAAGGSVDVRMELLDASGTVVATAAPANNLAATLDYVASAGIHYIRITPDGDGNPLSPTPTGYTSYGCVGDYTITGSVIPAAPEIIGNMTRVETVGSDFTYPITATNSPTTYTAAPLPAGLSLDPVTGVIRGQLLESGTFSITLGATNALGSGSALLSLTVPPSAPDIRNIPQGRLVTRVGGNFSTIAQVFSEDTANLQWYRDRLPVAGATSNTLSLRQVTSLDSGWYRLEATNGTGTSKTKPFYLAVIPYSSQVVGWGDDASGKLAIPADLDDAIAVSTKRDFSLALRADGTVIGWGIDSNNRTVPPAGLNNVVAIAAGTFHSTALLADGTLVGWGSTSVTSGGTSYPLRTFPQNMGHVIAIAGGEYHTLALNSEGQVFAWGLSDSGQATVPEGLADVIAISASSNHSAAVKRDGTVVAWGNNSSNKATVPASLTGAISVAAGNSFTAALKGDHSVVVWGSSSYTGVPAGLQASRIIGGLNDALAIRTDGTLAVWSTSASRTIPKAGQPAFADLTRVIGAACGSGYCIALTDTSPVFDSPYDAWAADHFTPAELADEAISGPNGNTDGDGLSNLLEFAFGTDPKTNDGATVAAESAGVVVTRGIPVPRITTTPMRVDFRVIFGRRIDHAAAGLAYTPQFSNDMSQWFDGTTAPTVLATDSEIEIASVPYPFFLPDGKKARFFRVKVEIP